MKTEGSSFVGRCGNDTSPVGSATYHNGFVLEFRIEHPFHRDEERVEVDMDYGSSLHIDYPGTFGNSVILPP